MPRLSHASPSPRPRPRPSPLPSPSGRQTDLAALVGSLVVVLLLWVLAYQVPFATSLPIGGETTTHRREYDAPFLGGFHASEPAHPAQPEWWMLSPGYAYRWTSSTATVSLPGVGGGRWVVRVLATSGRPDNGTTVSRWHTGTGPVRTVLPATPRRYHLLAAADRAGDLVLHLSAPPYHPPDDPRELGFVVRSVEVSPTRVTQGVLRLPSLSQLSWMAAMLVLVYSLSRWLVLGTRSAVGVILSVAVLQAALLATHRLTLTLFTPRLLVVVCSCWGLALLAWGVGRLAAESRTPAGLPAAMKPLMALVLLAFALRLGGMLHPQARFSDHRMNANNLLETGLGKLHFTEGLPREAGGGQSPYPPGVYLLAAPAQLFAPPTMASRVVVVQSSVALFDSLGVALLWLLLHRAGWGQRGATMGAVLYLAPAPLLTSFSVGEYANIGGQFMALPVLVLLAWTDDAWRTWDYRLSLLALLCVGMLGHMGVALSLTLVLIVWGGLALAPLVLALLPRSLPNRASLRPSVVRSATFLLTGAAAAAVVVSIYYSSPTFTHLFARRLAGTADRASQPTAPLPEALLDIATRFLPAHSKLLPILLLCGAAGACWLWLRCLSAPVRGHQNSPALRSLSRVVVAWWGGVLLSLGLFLLVRQGVRWEHFLYPVLCLGAGPLLAAFWRRGPTGTLVAGGAVLLPLWYGLMVWIERLRFAYH